jgi:hypothetical protein
MTTARTRSQSNDLRLCAARQKGGDLCRPCQRLGQRRNETET